MRFPVRILRKVLILRKLGFYNLLIVLTLFSVFYLIFTVFLASPASSQANNYDNQTDASYTTPNNNPDVPKNLHTYTQNVMLEVISSMVCQITGSDPVNPNQKCLGIDSTTGKIGFVENGGGAIGATGGLIALTYTPPIHFSDYVHYLADNFGIAKKANAQEVRGIGTQGIWPLRAIWLAFTKIVYLLFIMVFIIVGLAIMLRVKIDPRTVMAIENQIPRIVIGIIIVTFSFAIAGFLIDVMFVSIYVIFNVFMNIISDPKVAGTDIAGNIQDTQLNFNSNNVFQVFNSLVGFTDIVTNASGNVKDIITNLFSADGGDTFIWSGVKEIFTNGFAIILGGLFGILALLIIGFAILFSMFRIWFMLIMAYVNILLDVVLAPFWIVTGLFPGSSLGVGAWVRDMIANLAVFPAVILMFLFAKVFTDAFQTSVATGSPIIVLPLVGNPGGNAFGPLIGLGFILMTPKVAEMVKAALKAPKLDLSPIAQGVSAGGAVPGRLGQAGINRALGVHYDAKSGQLRGAGGQWGAWARALGLAH